MRKSYRSQSILTLSFKFESNSKSSYINLVKKISADRQKEIRRWIQNEQVLCGLDSNYWTKYYAWVGDEKGQIFKFKDRRSQEVFDSVIAGFDEKQVSIEMLILKSQAARGDDEGRPKVHTTLNVYSAHTSDYGLGRKKQVRTYWKDSRYCI